MKADWFRWWHGTVDDPKFRTVARKAGCSVADVIAVWACLLERASQSGALDPKTGDADVTQGDDEHAARGSIAGFDAEDSDSLLGFDDGRTALILEAMIEKGLIVGDRLQGWEKRQPKREDSSAARTREYRDRKKAGAGAPPSPPPPPHPSGHSDAVVTHGDAQEGEGDKRGEKNQKTGAGAPPKFDPLAVALPVGLPPEVWAKWVKARSQAKKPLTELAVEQQLLVVTTWLSEGFSAAQIFDPAIRGSWQGIFRPKEAPANATDLFSPAPLRSPRAGDVAGTYDANMRAAAELAKTHPELIR